MEGPDQIERIVIEENKNAENQIIDTSEKVPPVTTTPNDGQKIVDQTMTEPEQIVESEKIVGSEKLAEHGELTEPDKIIELENIPML